MTGAMSHDFPLDALAYATLLREALDQIGRWTWPVQGLSMYPTLLPGSVIDVVPLKSPPKPGDIVIFVQDGRILSHRIVDYKQHGWITLGDANRFPDPPIKFDNIIGHVSTARLGPYIIWHDNMPKTRWVLRYHILRILQGLRVGFFSFFIRFPLN